MDMDEHSGELSCFICNKKFSRESDKLVHERKHTDEKPFACNICGESFGRMTILNRHRQMHCVDQEVVYKEKVKTIELRNEEEQSLDLTCNAGGTDDLDNTVLTVGTSVMDDSVDTSSATLDSDCDSLGGDDLDLDKILAYETNDQRKYHEELDLRDKIIEKSIKTAEDNEKKLDAQIDAIKEDMKKTKDNWASNKVRAGTLSKYGSDEMKMLAEASLSRIERIEKNEILSDRKKPHNGSGGQQQSLFYRQIWYPFTDDQHGLFIFNFLGLNLASCLVSEAVLDVLTMWHNQRGETDNHYIWNVTLPGKWCFQ